MLPDPINILARYDISIQNGFLPHQFPIKRLQPEYYSPWESLMDKLSQLIATKNVRQSIDSMPVLDLSRLMTETEWRRAYLILSFVTHAYIWAGDGPSQILPPSICRPYLEAAEHFDLPSTATYAALNLWNWTPQTPHADLTFPENIRMLHTFTGTQDEEWFYAISVSIEVEGAKIIPAMLECFDAVQSCNSTQVARLLHIINTCIQKLGTILDRMHQRCDPDVFYHQIRPFLAGSKGMENAGLPNGVFYDEGEGSGTWRQYSGGSNAQSSLIQLLDVMLGVEHHAKGDAPTVSDKPLKTPKSKVKAKQGYIEEMRRYMPKQHRLFLQYATSRANIREYVSRYDTDSTVRDAYTQAVESLTLFRDKHIGIVARYIIAPSRKSRPPREMQGVNIATVSIQRQQVPNGACESIDDVALSGTGGTHLIPFLKQTRDETRRAGVLS